MSVRIVSKPIEAVTEHRHSCFPCNLCTRVYQCFTYCLGSVSSPTAQDIEYQLGVYDLQYGIDTGNTTVIHYAAFQLEDSGLASPRTVAFWKLFQFGDPSIQNTPSTLTKPDQVEGESKSHLG